MRIRMCQVRKPLYRGRNTHTLPGSCAFGFSAASAPSPLDARSRFAVFAQRPRCIAIEGE
jgi:hypothetical protein